MRVFNNMTYGLKLQRRPNQEIQQRVQEAAELLQLSKLMGGEALHMVIRESVAVDMTEYWLVLDQTKLHFLDPRSGMRISTPTGG